MPTKATYAVNVRCVPLIFGEFLIKARITDIYNYRARLLLPESRGSPTKIQVNLRLKKDLFSTPGVQFFVCCDCGRIEFTTNAVFGQT
jgi:hypothetical protein